MNHSEGTKREKVHSVIVQASYIEILMTQCVFYVHYSFFFHTLGINSNRKMCLRISYIKGNKIYKNNTFSEKKNISYLKKLYITLSIVKDRIFGFIYTKNSLHVGNVRVFF